MQQWALKLVALTAIVAVTIGCTALQNLQAFVQPPRFAQDTQNRSEIRLLGTSGASVRIWTRVASDPRPLISVDTKKKELVGDDKNAGREWHPQGEPIPVRKIALRQRSRQEIAHPGKGAPGPTDDYCPDDANVGKRQALQDHGRTTH